MADIVDWHGAGVRLRHQLFRHVHHVGAGTGRYRRDVPVFSPFLGWLGVFLTGSDTSSNALFGSLQSTTAQQINVSDTLLVAANTSGGVTGKMISPQSIAVACAATGMVGRESELFRYTVKHSLILPALSALSRCCRRMCLLECWSRKSIMPDDR